MKTIRFSPLRAAAASLLLGAAASLALVAGAGCESADSYEISVTPAYQEIKPGGSVALTARGWSDYKWALDVDGVGHLNRTTGESVVFTAVSDVSNTTVNVTVTAVGSGSGSSTNSASAGGYTASARIKIL